jgi:uncharacterized membrane protein
VGIRALFGAVIVLFLVYSNRPATGAVMASIQSLGYFSGATTANGNGVSANGAVAVGTGQGGGSGNQAYRWTSATGPVALGRLLGTSTAGTARAVSGDGLVVVGDDFVNASSDKKAYRWTSGTGMQDLGFLARLGGPPQESFARGVNFDGSVVVGISGGMAFRWTQATSMVNIGPASDGSNPAAAYAVSPDGSVVVGTEFDGTGPYTQAMRWTSGTGMVPMGNIPGGTGDSYAYALSSDGAVIVGQGHSATREEAFRWTSGGGMVGLGHIAGPFTGAEALGISGDGSLIVGDDSGSAFIWDSSHGMRNLSTVLTSYGVNMTGWTLNSASGISTDGTTIVGTGFKTGVGNVGFLVTLPEPGACGAVLFGFTFLARRRRH